MAGSKIARRIEPAQRAEMSRGLMNCVQGVKASFWDGGVDVASIRAFETSRAEKRQGIMSSAQTPYNK